MTKRIGVKIGPNQLTLESIDKRLEEEFGCDYVFTLFGPRAKQTAKRVVRNWTTLATEVKLMRSKVVSSKVNWLKPKRVLWHVLIYMTPTDLRS